MSEKIIEIKDLSFAYRRKDVLKGINLTIYKSDFLGIIGPNGGGKTTLLKAILGLLTPDSGDVLLKGKEISSKTSKKIGYVPQIPSFEKHFPITVREIVLTGRLSDKGFPAIYNKSDLEFVNKVLKDLEIEEYSDSCMCDLSGGERQRVFIARALCMNPEILLLDEPTSNMDSKIENKFYKILENLNKKIPIVLVSHDIGAISSHANKVACLNGRLFYHDSKELTQDMIENTYHCPIDLIAHGVAHRVLPDHGKEGR